MPTRPPAARDRPAAAEGSGLVLGIDVGGTKIAGGLVDPATGEVLLRCQAPTGYLRGGGPVLHDVAVMAAGLMDDARHQGVSPLGVGIGVAELVEPSGRIFSDYRIKWRDLDVASAIAAVTGGLPVSLTADVRAAALAEARFGAGRGIDDFYYLTIGTGVSGVLVQEGRPYAGSRGAALVIANGRTLTRCAACGAVTSRVAEDIASGPGLVAAWGRGGAAEDVLDAARAGDGLALAAIEEAAQELGRIVSLMVNGLDPALVIVGGGLGSAPGPYFDRLSAAIRAGLWDGDQRDLPILRAALGPDAGLIGAALAGRDHLSSERLRQPTEPQRETTHGISR